MDHYSHKQAIVTKYLGPTDHRGSRIKAKSISFSVTLGWDCTLNDGENHQRAARALMEKMGWNWSLLSSWLPDSAMAHLAIPEEFEE